MGHHIGHGEGRVRVQRDGRYLELLIAEAGSVERLEGGWKLKKKKERGIEERKQVCEKLGWRAANNNLQREVREPQDRWESEITAF